MTRSKVKPKLSARERVERHERLLFERAYPEDARTLEAAEDGLARMAEQRFPDESGLASSVIHCAFSLPVVRWLRARQPDAVSLFVDGEGFWDKLDEALPSILSPAEREAVADGYVGAEEWAGRAGVKDLLGALIARIDSLGADAAAHDALWGALELPVTWELGRGPLSLTFARTPRTRAVFKRAPAAKKHVDLRSFATRAPRGVRRVTGAEAAGWIDAARAAVTARLREMHTIIHADPRDVVVADLGGGVQCAVFGVVPEARHALRAFHGYLLARNGVPIGYGDLVSLFEWGEVNFHIFEAFRRAESSRIYAELVRLFHHRFGVRYVYLNPYQFGRHNEEAIRTGAFWFYEKLGFRPSAAAQRKIHDEERAAIDRDPSHRTTAARLRVLAREPMSLIIGGDAAALESRWSGFHPLRVGLAVARAAELDTATNAALERHRDTRLAYLLGGRFPGNAGDALARMAPILALMPLSHWPPKPRRALGDAIRAKGGPRELDYLRAISLDATFFRTAVVALGTRG